MAMIGCFTCTIVLASPEYRHNTICMPNTLYSGVYRGKSGRSLMMQNRKHWNHCEMMNRDEMLIGGKHFIQVTNAERTIVRRFGQHLVTSMSTYRYLEPTFVISDSYWTSSLNFSPHSGPGTRKWSHRNDYFTSCWDFMASVPLLGNVMNRQLKSVIVNSAENCGTHKFSTHNRKLSDTCFIWQKLRRTENLQISYLKTTQKISAAHEANAMIPYSLCMRLLFHVLVHDATATR